MDGFQKQFEAVSVPYPKDTVTPLMEEQKKKVVSLFVKPLSGSSTNIFFLGVHCTHVTDQRVIKKGVHVQSESYIYSTHESIVHVCLRAMKMYVEVNYFLSSV